MTELIGNKKKQIIPRKLVILRKELKFFSKSFTQVTERVAQLCVENIQLLKVVTKSKMIMMMGMIMMEAEWKKLEGKIRRKMKLQ